jgi:hypothetical protein
MENKRLNIRYIDRFIEEDGIKLPVYKKFSATTSHTKRYHNTLYLLADLKGCARNLMDFFTEVMDNDNYVSSNKGIIEKFISDMNDVNVKYGVDSINKAIKNMVLKTL